MSIKNGYFWKDYFDSIYIKQVDFLYSFLVSKVRPTFADVDEEAEDIAEKEYERLGAISTDEDGDMSDLADQARDKGVEYFSLMNGLKNGVVGLFCVSLYHLFEKQIFTFYKKEILGISEENNADLLKRQVMNERLKKKDIDLQHFSSYGDIELLRLICNVFKHGEGRSEIELRKIKPDYFKYHKLEDPLLGNDFIISIEDFDHYTSSVKDFWQELGEKIIH